MESDKHQPTQINSQKLEDCKSNYLQDRDSSNIRKAFGIDKDFAIRDINKKIEQKNLEAEKST